MSVIKAVQSFVALCPYIQDFAGARVHVDFTQDRAANFGVSSAGSTVIKSYFDGTDMVQHNFSLYARQFTDSDLQRISNTEFLENFTNWLDEKTRKGELPDLGESAQAESMSAAGGSLSDMDEDGKRGVYQIQFNLIYQKGGISYGENTLSKES